MSIYRARILEANSAEEEVAGIFCASEGLTRLSSWRMPPALKRNLNLVMQATEITDNIVLCQSMDEAEKKKISIDLEALRSRLGIPWWARAPGPAGLAGLMDAMWDRRRPYKTEPVASITAPR